jgi:hypothetical protein
MRVDPRHAHRLRVLRGTAYITKEGDAADYFLQPGQEMEVESHHLTLVQGWPEVEVEVS